MLIGGLILDPGGQRTFVIRALGPSLNVNGALANPQIEVRAPDGTLVGRNDNWRDSQQQQISATGWRQRTIRKPRSFLPSPTKVTPCK